MKTLVSLQHREQLAEGGAMLIMDCAWEEPEQCDVILLRNSKCLINETVSFRRDKKKG